MAACGRGGSELSQPMLLAASNGVSCFEVGFEVVDPRRPARAARERAARPARRARRIGASPLRRHPLKLADSQRRPPRAARERAARPARRTRGAGASTLGCHALKLALKLADLQRRSARDAQRARNRSVASRLRRPLLKFMNL
eukprot:TRINITY_DN1610_c0_g1_i5.p1 TRINITY_DN1610_c0_g1~~TRINITY_DN1610_c0_g1_i5.p1  ORF type:complete len:143 (+),score=8.23 TRINITY_DN1610_c0_g1_i5:76-504(+)